jgi:uncharacterized protein YlzI (FlbEa/FlbD family)
MGWGTSFTADIYLNRIIFNSKYEVQSKIEELEENINRYREEILMYASATPKDIFPNSEEDILFSIKCKINDLFECLEDDYRLLTRVHHFMEHIESTPDFDFNQYKDI